LRRRRNSGARQSRHIVRRRASLSDDSARQSADGSRTYRSSSASAASAVSRRPATQPVARQATQARATRPGRRVGPARRYDQYPRQVLYHDHHDHPVCVCVAVSVSLLLLLTLSACSSDRPFVRPSVCLCLVVSPSLCVYVAHSATGSVSHSRLYQPVAAVQFYVSYYTILFRRAPQAPAQRNGPASLEPSGILGSRVGNVMLMHSLFSIQCVTFLMY